MFEANTGNAKAVSKVDKPEQMFEMLQLGRVDLVLYTKADGLALIREKRLSTISDLRPALKDVNLYLYLNRKHQALVPKLAAAIKAMKEDGTYNRLLADAGIQ